MKVLLDNYQVNAIKIKEKNVLVVAAPGSGKTTVIINRVNYLIEERKARTRDIIVITFTKAAAENMKNRYKNTFNKTVSPFFGTFHGLFYKILLREGYKINIIESVSKRQQLVVTLHLDKTGTVPQYYIKKWQLCSPEDWQADESLDVMKSIE